MDIEKARKHQIDELTRQDMARMYGFIPEGFDDHFGIPFNDGALAERAIKENWKSINSPSGLPNEKPWPVGEVGCFIVPGGLCVCVSCDDESDWLREVPDSVFPLVKVANDEIRRRLEEKRKNS